MKSVLVSACLLGEKCRYDGRSKPNEAVINKLKEYNVIPICPEVMGGLSTPRNPSEIIGDKVIMINGRDVTLEYKRGAEIALNIALKNKCEFAILKARSPSCGKGLIYDGTYSGTLTKGNGICAELLMKNGIAVLDEEEIEKLDL
ncbi:MAG: DUF523 domain-containing protein [Clostridia bacterium]|nr:DUF523 domain-containing protein [Clostridia bacterium]